MSLSGEAQSRLTVCVSGHEPQPHSEQFSNVFASHAEKVGNLFFGVLRITLANRVYLSYTLLRVACTCSTWCRI